MSEQIKMASPWVQYANTLKAMFEKDNEITIKYDNDKPEVLLYVDSASKADALAKLLPNCKDFGNVRLLITIVPSNKEENLISLYRDLFRDNPAVDDIVTISNILGVDLPNPITYVIFKKEVVQYYNDDLSDAHGNKTTLYQEIAKDIFEKANGILFCTNNE